ncbi:hypothetical protein [Natronosalvus caseinilyticus]|uniref:hypothetical protein n=1 Tax=Natronosalvus caseinilyticus TaxID=2953747 RepID=UPI0028AF999C|nr:hypothetical protein [Natronosalvus caseinilyticus]
MSNDATTTGRTIEREPANTSALDSAAFVAAAITFLAGGVMVIWASPPPSESPVFGILAHGLWALAAALLAIGAIALVLSNGRLRRSLAGTLSIGALGLGVVVGLQWVTWAYVDLRAAEADGYDLALETVITPFGAGHLLMYAILIGGGVALLAWALARTRAARRGLSLAGVAVGALTVGTAVLSTLAGLGGGSEGHWLFDVATLLIPLCYLWAMAVGIDLYRRS